MAVDLKTLLLIYLAFPIFHFLLYFPSIDVLLLIAIDVSRGKNKKKNTTKNFKVPFFLHLHWKLYYKHEKSDRTRTSYCCFIRRKPKSVTFFF